MMTTGLEDASLEGRVASLAASATSDDAAAVRAVIEAYGDRLTAADVPGIISLYTGNAAVMQPGLETTVGIRQLRATYDAFENMRLDFTFRFEDIIVSGDLAAVRTTGQGAITIRGTGETQPARFRELFVLERTGSDWKIAQYMFQQMPEQLGGGCSGIWRLRHTDSGTFRRPLAVIEHDAGARQSHRLPARTGAVQVDDGVTGTIGGPASGWPVTSAISPAARRASTGRLN